MKIITIANEKGGIGKTTTATAMASILASKGYKTLFIDADPQCNSTDTYKAVIDGVETLYDVLLEDDGKRVSFNDAVQHTENGDIIAGDELMKRAKIILQGDELYRTKEQLEQLKGYDYVVIDTNPGYDEIRTSFLYASDDVIIPIFPDRYSLQGLKNLYNIVNRIKTRVNPKLNIAGILLVKYARNQILSKDAVQFLTNTAPQMGTSLFNAKIREASAVKHAQAARKHLIDYDKKSTAAEDYIAFVDEYLKGR